MNELERPSKYERKQLLYVGFKTLTIRIQQL